MNCNCNNNGQGDGLVVPKIKHVFGNVLRIAIPLTLRTLELVETEIDGQMQQEVVATDTDFIPSSEHPVQVIFSKVGVRFPFDAIMHDGNVAYIEEKGKIPVGTYDITITCYDDNGNPYRFNQNTILQVVNSTIEAGIETPIEYEVQTWYLNAALYLALKGEDGVGIDDIVTESSSEIGGINYITFVLTDGRTRTFTILNGSGSVDQELDTTSPQPIANKVVATKFNELDEKIANLFGDSDYDSNNKVIRFWDKGKTKILATIDARPFIKDGMVSNVYISGTTLVVTFNTDSGREAIGVPLTSIFNPNNYYNKTQVDNRFSNVSSSLESMIANSKNFIVTLTTSGTPPDLTFTADKTINQIIAAKDAGRTVFLRYDNLFFFPSAISLAEAYFVCPEYLGAQNALIAKYNNSTWSISPLTNVTGIRVNGGDVSSPDFNSGIVDITVSTGGEGTVTSIKVGNDDYEPTDGVVDLSNAIPDVQSAIAGLVDSAPQTLDTLNELAAALGDDPNFATTVTNALGDKVDKVNGKGLSTNDYTTAEKNKLAGIASGAEVNVQADWNVTNTSSDAFIKNKPSIPTKTSDLINDNGYTTNTGTLTEADFDVSTRQDGTIVMTVGEDTYTIDLNHEHPQYAEIGALAEVATSGSYNDLTDKPVIPEDADLSGYYDKTEVDGLLDDKVDKVSGKGLSANDYTTAEKNKLAGIAAGAEVNVNADWNATSGDARILNKPTLSTVATTGSYNDLENKPTIPAAYDDTTLSGRVTALENAGYITTETDPTVPAWAKSPTKPSYNASEVGAVPTTRKVNGKALSADISLGASDVGALPDTTTIPSDLGDLTNNAGYTKNAGTITGVKMNGVTKGTSGVVDLGTVITSHQDISGKANSADLATVATSGSYNDLSNKPTIPAAQVQSDWNATSGMGVILNKPTIPSKTSDLTNDSGYIDKAMYYGESTTAAATMPKVCTVETFPTYTNNGVTHAKEGTIIAVKFTNSDTNTTAAPELNVNGIGAKAIMYNNAIITSTAKNTVVAGYAKQIAYYRYDPELDGGNGAWEFLAKSVDSNSTYSQASLGQGYATQSNSAAATAITASISSYALSDGGIVTIKFNYDVPANATLNISSKGAKAIYNKGAAIAAGVIKAGDTATFIYSTYYHLISVDSWQDNQGGGMQATYSNGTITITGSGSNQPTYSNGTITL